MSNKLTELLRRKPPVLVLMWMQESNRCWIPVTLMDLCEDPGADCAAQSHQHAADPGLLWTSRRPATTQPCSAVTQPRPDTYGLGRDVMEKFSAFPAALFPLQADALGGLWFPFVTSQTLNFSRFYKTRSLNARRAAGGGSMPCQECRAGGRTRWGLKDAHWHRGGDLCGAAVSGCAASGNEARLRVSTCEPVTLAIWTVGGEGGVCVYRGWI